MVYCFDNKTNQLIQDFNEIFVEKCNIDKHFSDYKDLFYHINDLENYFCPIVRKKNQSLFGMYGNNKPFLYYIFIFQNVKTIQMKIKKIVYLSQK